MIVNFHGIPKEHRDDVRYVNSKGHAPYIRYLLLTRFPVSKIHDELLKLGLRPVTERQAKSYFKHALLPFIKEAGLMKYYKKYDKYGKDERLTIDVTFLRSETDRESFVSELIPSTQTQPFFYEEVRSFYGPSSIPTTKNGTSVFSIRYTGWEEILISPKRHVIDNFLLEGRSYKEISEHLSATFNIRLEAEAIGSYAEGFMNARVYDLARVIEDLENQLAEVSESIKYTASNHKLSHGERVTVISRLKKSEELLKAKVNRMKSLHNTGAFSSAVLEYANIRDILADVLQRSHRRFVMMDSRTDDDVIPSLTRIASTVDRMASRIIDVDEVASGVEKRSVTEEMIEIITPTLDRMEEEEREAVRAYEELIGIEPARDDDILGVE